MPQRGEEESKTRPPSGSDFAITVADRPVEAAAWSPFVLAILLTAGYGVLCTVYIVLAARSEVASDPGFSKLPGMETIKGVGFVSVSGGLFFALCWLALSRLKAERNRLQRQRRLMVDVNRRSMAASFARSVAHDINNLLTVAQCQLSSAMDKLPSGSNSDLADLETSLADIAGLSHRLARIGREPTYGERELASVTDCVRQAIETCQQHLGVRRRQLTARLDDVAPQSIHVPLVTRAVVNLILNAAEATLENGRIEVRLFQDQGATVIEVHDDGPGIAGEAAKRVFEEFYTTKPAGTGLGLFVVSVCAEEHGGTADALRSPLGGACLRMTLADNPAGPPR